jgi:hypothetical protein
MKAACPIRILGIDTKRNAFQRRREVDMVDVLFAYLLHASYKKTHQIKFTYSSLIRKKQLKMQFKD